MLDRTAIVRVIDAWEHEAAATGLHDRIRTRLVLDLADRLLAAMRAQLEEQHTDWFDAVRGKSTDERLDAVRNISERSYQRGFAASEAGGLEDYRCTVCGKDAGPNICNGCR